MIKVKKLNRTNPLKTDKKIIELIDWMCDNDSIIEATEIMTTRLAPVQRDSVIKELDRTRLNSVCNFLFDRELYLKEFGTEKEFLRKCSYGSIMELTETLTTCLAPVQRDSVIEELEALKKKKEEK